MSTYLFLGGGGGYLHIYIQTHICMNTQLLIRKIVRTQIFLEIEKRSVLYSTSILPWLIILAATVSSVGSTIKLCNFA